MPRLSQNFLYDPSILKRIMQIAKLNAGDTVVEIGPGPGRLTVMLSERVKRVIAVELDRELYEKLKDTAGARGNIELVRGDALRFDYSGLGRFKVVSNIPYHITTPLIFKLLEHRENLESMTLTVQKEVAERIAAAPGGKDYGMLSISVQYYGRPELKFLIPKNAFRPVPRVDSACIHIEIYERPAVEVKDEKLFFTVLRTAFSHRRKTVLNSLRSVYADIREVLAALGIDPARRPETLSIEEFARIAERLGGRKAPVDSDD